MRSINRGHDLLKVIDKNRILLTSFHIIIILRSITCANYFFEYDIQTANFNKTNFILKTPKEETRLEQKKSV